MIFVGLVNLSVTNYESFIALTHYGLLQKPIAGKQHMCLNLFRHLKSDALWFSFSFS